MTERLYASDPYLLEFDAAVVAAASTRGGPPSSSTGPPSTPRAAGSPGTPARSSDARVLAVIEDGADVLHVLDRPVAAERVHGRVDADRRRDHMQQHHGQHLLSKAFVEVAAGRRPSPSTSAARTTTIDLDRFVGEEQARAAERRANEVVWQARPGPGQPR